MMCYRLEGQSLALNVLSKATNLNWWLKLMCYKLEGQSLAHNLLGKETSWEDLLFMMPRFTLFYAFTDKFLESLNNGQFK